MLKVTVQLFTKRDTENVLVCYQMKFKLILLTK